MLMTLYLCACFLLGWNIKTMIAELGRAVGILLATTLFILLSVLFACAQANAGEAEAFAALRPTALYVQGLGCSGSAGIVAGSGQTSYLLTNAHVCLCAGVNGRVYALTDAGGLVESRIVKMDFGKDLCLAMTAKPFSGLRLGTAAPRMKAVYTRGYPMTRAAESVGFAVGDTQWDGEFPLQPNGKCPPNGTPMLGFDGQPEGCFIRFTVTRSSLYVRPGSSGSPVVDSSGGLVGVVSSWGGGGIMFNAGLVRYEDVKSFLDGL